MASHAPAKGEPAGKARRRSGGVVVAALFVAALVLRPLHHRLRHSMPLRVERKPPPSTPTSAKKKMGARRNDGRANALFGKSSAKHGKGSATESQRGHTPQEAEEPPANRSDAPLFYHLSPGSTGSRTLYHAACASGFPSVHHKSFCISTKRGIDGVPDDVVEGVRAHYEVLRLYQLAADCASLWIKGRLRVMEGRVVASASDSQRDNSSSGISDVATQLCGMSVREWSTDLRSHLRDVVHSGLVGLFDTPYPYLADEVLDLADDLRGVPPKIAMTERDPQGWAASRSRNHGILVCREEYSFQRLASEFDMLGCVDRAYEARAEHSEELHFWDVFRYRSHREPIDPAFQRGMARQMERHQETYLPLAAYAPDFFGVHSTEGQRSKPIKEKDVAVDIRRHILGSEGGEAEERGGSKLEKMHAAWRKRYRISLTCRGRVDWKMTNDTSVERYHLPKTCKDGDESNAHTIPLI